MIVSKFSTLKSAFTSYSLIDTEYALSLIHI